MMYVVTIIFVTIIAIANANFILPEPMNPSEHLDLQTKQCLLPDHDGYGNDDKDDDCFRYGVN